MSKNFEKIIINFIKAEIKKKQKIDKNTQFNNIVNFDSLSFVKLIIFLNNFSIKISSEKLSKIKKINDLVIACEKNKK